MPRIDAHKYWIKSAGRAGSNLVREYIQHSARALSFTTKGGDLDTIRQQANQAELIGRNSVVHDHTDWIPFPTHQWHLVIVRRRNTWAQAVSWIIANTTREYFEYSSKKFTPFHLEWSHLENVRNNLLELNRTHDEQKAQLTWRTTHIVYFEDFVNTPLHLDSVLQSTKQQPAETMLESRKSPHTPGKLFVNWQEIQTRLQEQCQD